MRKRTNPPNDDPLRARPPAGAPNDRLTNMSDNQRESGQAPLVLESGERVLARLRPDRGRYWRDHGILALLGMGGAGVVLWALGSSHVAIGALGAVLALVVRGLYLFSEQMTMVWVVTDRRLVLPDGRMVALPEIETIRKLMGDLQLITCAGDKHLIRHLADPDGAAATIRQARERRVRRLRN
ncbi:MAG: Protein of unknown function (DUF3121) [Rhodobacteraceae bacterium HLUCCA12]|nr:MAG: Protein of unknown function (DUF3121) [Rhodobacteraceae bacterium HLUCCA12]